MKAFLMFPDRDFDSRMELISALTYFRRAGDRDFDPWEALPWQGPILFQDLQLDLIFKAMAGEDKFLYEVARRAVLKAAEQDLEIVLFRQGILHDCLESPDATRELYTLSVKAIEAAREAVHWMTSRSPSGTLSGAVEAMQSYMKSLHGLRSFAETHKTRFVSTGFQRFFSELEAELTEEYFADVHAHLKRLKFTHGVPVSVDLGDLCKGHNYVLRMPKAKEESWWAWLFGPHEEGYTITLAPRDEAGATALGELRERGLALVADALQQAVDHIRSFFEMIRTELAFYVGCLNLHDKLTELGEPVSIPEVLPASKRAFSCTELFDVALALQMGHKIIGNGVDTEAANVIVVTGANRGGKSTFLRSLGQAQLMMQAGMMVGASSFRANIADGVFTHFKREEDRSMSSGKLDEELVRMSDIIDHLKPNGLVLFNESFASTNEREGSEIAGQVTEALEQRQVKLVHVTHLFTFSNGLSDDTEHRYFLRADPGESGEPSFRLHPGLPLSTSYGEDIYRRYFKDETGEEEPS